MIKRYLWTERRLHARMNDGSSRYEEALLLTPTMASKNAIETGIMLKVVFHYRDGDFYPTERNPAPRVVEEEMAFEYRGRLFATSDEALEAWDRDHLPVIVRA